MINEQVADLALILRTESSCGYTDTTIAWR